jgi:hypothetical protein
MINLVVIIILEWGINLRQNESFKKVQIYTLSSTFKLE